MTIKHFYDKALAQGSYAIESNGEIALIDPCRDSSAFIKFAEDNNAKIVAVFETHPHADFISSHLEVFNKTGASIYINEKVGAEYDHKVMNHNDTVKIGKIIIKALFTPGHSPDHNSYMLIDDNDEELAIFSGDALFVGDVGRPDLREGAGNLQVSRKELAGMMYDTIHNVFNRIKDDVKVYPAHGAGSLCGKNMSDDLSSTIGREKETNWAFKIKDRDKFIETFLEGQAFIPQYFPFSVEVNRKGAPDLIESLNNIKVEQETEVPGDCTIIDIRSNKDFKNGHVEGAINIQNIQDDKFETWLGTIVAPDEKFCLISDDTTSLQFAFYRAAKIGYETNISVGIIHPKNEKLTSESIDIDYFKNNLSTYTIIDVRNESEVKDRKIFEEAINIPLNELRKRATEIDSDKPIVVHCAGGYRSAAGASILESALDVPVFDLSEAVKSF